MAAAKFGAADTWAAPPPALPPEPWTGMAPWAGCASVSRMPPASEQQAPRSVAAQLGDMSRVMDDRHAEVLRGVKELACAMSSIERQMAQRERRVEELLGLSRLTSAFAAATGTNGRQADEAAGDSAPNSPQVARQAPIPAFSSSASPDNAALGNTPSYQFVQQGTRLQLDDIAGLHDCHGNAHVFSEMEVEEPSGKEGKTEGQRGMSRWKRFARSESFDLCIAAVVGLNSFVMAAELEWLGTANAANVGKTINPATMENLEWVAGSFAVMEHVFCFCFAMEMLIRLAAYGCSYFLTFMHMLDLLLVVLTIVENYVFLVLDFEFPDIAILRLLRLVKLLKVVKVMRLMRFFHPLRVLIVSIGNSIGALWWSIVLLSVLQLMAAIFMTQMLLEVIADENQDLEMRVELYEYFGCWTNSMLTMFEITLAPGAWANVGRLLIFRVSKLYVIFFVPYVWGITFAVIRVVSAIFLKQTMTAVDADDEIVNHDIAMKQNMELGKLRAIFSEGDKDGQGTLDEPEFHLLLKDERVVGVLSDMGLVVTEVQGLFKLMDDGDGHISFEEFISGVLRLRGGAKNIDLATLLFENKKIRNALQALRQDLGMAPVLKRAGSDI